MFPADNGPGVIDAASAAGLGPIKVNAVIRRGWNEDQILPLLERFRGTGHTVRFIEYMDVGTTNDWKRDEVDQKLNQIMKDIHQQCVKYGQEKGGYVNYVKGANIAGFVKVADAMLAQGMI